MRNNLTKYNSIKILNSIFIVFILLIGCERDDICPESTSTTPNLIIEFVDINNDSSPKTVNGLSVRAESIEDFVIFNSDTDNLSLPLQFADEGSITRTRFEFTKDSNETNTEPNTDIVELTYTPRFEYVSRACGYKAVFENIQITVINDGDNWILNTEVLQSLVENENETHLAILH